MLPKELRSLGTALATAGKLWPILLDTIEAASELVDILLIDHNQDTLDKGLTKLIGLLDILENTDPVVATKDIK